MKKYEVENMTKKTVTRADLIEAVYQEVGLSRNESADLVETVLSEIATNLTSGENVKISSFGSFIVLICGSKPLRSSVIQLNSKTVLSLVV